MKIFFTLRFDSMLQMAGFLASTRKTEFSVIPKGPHFKVVFQAGQGHEEAARKRFTFLKNLDPQEL